MTATIACVLTGCLKSPTLLPHLQADMKRVATDSIHAGDSSVETRSAGTSSPLRIGLDEPFFQFFPDDYWAAVGELDLDGSRALAASVAEKQFADALAAVTAGDYKTADSELTELSSEKNDLTIAVTAKTLLAMTLLYERDWSRLRALDLEWGLSNRDRENVAALNWGRAFAGAPASAIFFPENPVTLQLHLTAVGTPTVKVAINGKQYDFWLDTGSSITVLSSSVAEDAHVAALGTDTLIIGTFAGVATVRPAVVSHLELGQIVIADNPAIIMDDALMRVRGTGVGIPNNGLAVAGIIGWDVIRHFDVSMDYRSGRVVFEKPLELGTMGTPKQNLIWVGRPLIIVHAKYAGELHFALDTGAESTFLDNSILQKLRAKPVATTSRAYGIGRTVGGTVRMVHQQKLNIAGRSLIMREVMVNDQPATGFFNCDGILGSDLGEHGVIRIDATNGLFSIATVE